MAVDISSRRIEDESILESARRLILARGVRRVTITDVAREAGLSRMTVYRRWSSFPALLGSLMQREWDRVVDLLEPEAFVARAAQHGGARVFLVAQMVAACAAIRDSELLQALLRHDPEFLLPYLVERPGTIHRTAREAVEAAVVAGQADGTIRAGDREVIAAAVVVAAQGFVVSTRSAGADIEPARLDGELAAMIDAYLGAPR